ncbi:hypothetical protein LROSL1_1187 [Furfurilactobacillus rossiae]|uniref:hypothetical protein n=1 Tax=Furfurilactobacillus rossiae TaxID=231049 RepID=UPI0015BCF978|nr:hypothetical protein [Furfurilactobacillus rossiae]QLE64004.1 hypothetical protein LROSL1_1187 [Furfurilactobacillus rossiae]
MSEYLVDPHTIKEYDLVELVDGRQGTVVYVPADPTLGFELDIGDSPATWDTIGIKPNQIKRIIEHA